MAPHLPSVLGGTRDDSTDQLHQHAKRSVGFTAPPAASGAGCSTDTACSTCAAYSTDAASSASSSAQPAAVSVEAAIRFAWAVCVPDSPDEKVCSFDVFCALARKLFLVTRLRANGVVDPHACMETVRKDWERFSALKPHLLVSDFERYWLQGVLNAEYGPKDDEAQWIVAMVHRIVEPRLRAKDPERLTVWLWREDADIFSAAMPARGAQRFHVANVKELQDYFERKVSAADPVLAPPPPPPPPPPNEALAALLAEASAPLAESSGVPPGAGAADQVFDMFDRDDSGYLDRFEVKKALRALRLQVESGEAAEILQSFDRDGDGKLDRAEFKDLVKKLQQQLEQAAAGPAKPRRTKSKSFSMLPSLPPKKGAPIGWQGDAFTRMHWHSIFAAPQRRERKQMQEALRRFEAREPVDGAAAVSAPEQALRAPWDLPPVRPRRRAPAARAPGLIRASSGPALPRRSSSSLLPPVAAAGADPADPAGGVTAAPPRRRGKSKSPQDEWSPVPGGGAPRLPPPGRQGQGMIPRSHSLAALPAHGRRARPAAPPLESPAAAHAGAGARAPSELAARRARVRGAVQLEASSLRVEVSGLDHVATWTVGAAPAGGAPPVRCAAPLRSPSGKKAPSSEAVTRTGDATAAASSPAGPASPAAPRASPVPAAGPSPPRRTSSGSQQSSPDRRRGAGERDSSPGKAARNASPGNAARASAMNDLYLRRVSCRDITF